jgi:hypothetical protein
MSPPEEAREPVALKCPLVLAIAILAADPTCQAMRGIRGQGTARYTSARKVGKLQHFFDGRSGEKRRFESWMGKGGDRGPRLAEGSYGTQAIFQCFRVGFRCRRRLLRIRRRFRMVFGLECAIADLLLSLGLRLSVSSSCCRRRLTSPKRPRGTVPSSQNTPAWSSSMRFSDRRRTLRWDAGGDGCSGR